MAGASGQASQRWQSRRWCTTAATAREECVCTHKGWPSVLGWRAATVDLPVHVSRRCGRCGAVFVRGAVLKRAFVWRTVWLACARTPRQEQ